MTYLAGVPVGFGVLAVTEFRGFTTEAAAGSRPRRWWPRPPGSPPRGALGAVCPLLLRASGGPPFAVFLGVGALAAAAYDPLLPVGQLVVQWVV